MKILLVNNYYYLRGGSERYFFNLFNLLKEADHEVIPFSVKDERNIASPYEKYFAQSIHFNNYKLSIKNIKISLNAIYSIEAKKKIESLINEIKPDIAHLHNIYSRISPSILQVLEKYEIPSIMTLHDYKLICPVYSFLSNGKICERCKRYKYYNAVLQRCNKGSIGASVVNCLELYIHKVMKLYEGIKMFIAPSEFMRNKMIEFGLDRNKILHIPNFINFNEYSPFYDFKDYFVYVGRISPEKGIITLIEAIKYLNINTKLYLIGEGPYEEKVKQIARGIKNVNFVGYQRGDELKSTIKESMFVIVPSEWYENFPFAILEAFALGKPVIGSNIGGLPELIKDKFNGLLFEPKNVNDLANKIQYLLENKEIIPTLGKNARRLIEEKYNSQIHYQELMEVYKRVRR
ncbi:MAG: glycosyltransferase family 4 protein [bacterium]